MTEYTLLSEAVEAALIRTPAVRQVHAVTPTSLPSAIAARRLRTGSPGGAARTTAEPAPVGADVGLVAQEPAGSTAMQVVRAIRAALDEEGWTDVPIRLRIVSVE